MKHRETFRVYAAIAALGATFVLSPNSRADLIAYEGFDYSSGDTLAGQSGGLGFSDAWSSSLGNFTIDSGSLSDPTGQLLTSGGNATTNSDAFVLRNLASSLGTTGTTDYISFLLRQNTFGTEGDHDFGGIDLGGSNTDGSGGLYIGTAGDRSGADPYVLGTSGDATSNTPSNVDSTLGQTALLVVKLDFEAGNDVATLYANPTPGSTEPSSGTVYSGVDLGNFTQIVIPSGGGSSWSVDEIRVGTTYADVTPVVPAPAAFSSGAALLAGLGLTRRRKLPALYQTSRNHLC